MSLIVSLFLGIVQGISEFLPISSSAHLSILENLVKISKDENSWLFFNFLLSLGTFLSVCIYYRKDLRRMFREGFDFINSGRKGTMEEGVRFTPAMRLAFLIFISTLPILVLLLFYGKFTLLFSDPTFVGLALIVMGTILFVSGKLVIGRKNAKTTKIRDAVMIGIAQACAMLPGLSRSGTTIVLGMAYGMERDFAVRFSLLASLPGLLILNIINLSAAVKVGVVWSELPIYMVGLVAACVTGYFAIGLLKTLTEKGKLGKFSYYCWALGVLTIFLSIIL